jgi:hypothetical protein
MHDMPAPLCCRPAHLALSAGLLWMGHGLAQAQPHNSSRTRPPSLDAAALYGRHCASCHGDQRTGGMGPALLPESLARQRPPNC